MWRAGLTIAFGAAIALLPAGCSSSRREEPRTAEEMKHLPILEGEHGFALNLYARLKQGDENLFFSPFSITTALAMTYAGAQGNTAVQMAKACGFDLPPERLHPHFAALLADLNSKERKQWYEFVVANALWGQQGFGFRKEFLELVQANYGGGLRQADFAKATEAARQTINRWVQEQTHDRIPEVIPVGVLSDLTVLVLTNAIYFKSRWAFHFDARLTREEPFTLLSGQAVSVPMMHGCREFHCKYADGADFQALELSYRGGHVAMVIFLPKKADGLPAFERSLTGSALAKWMSELGPQEAIVSLPRFTIASGLRLDETLRSLGMTDAFDPEAADFSGMVAAGGIWIKAALHKAFVDVNEAGTEAAAATAVVMEMKGEPGSPPVFRADHPFIFLIRDNRSGSILFLGRLMNPKE